MASTVDLSNVIDVDSQPNDDNTNTLWYQKDHVDGEKRWKSSQECKHLQPETVQTNEEVVKDVQTNEEVPTNEEAQTNEEVQTVQTNEEVQTNAEVQAKEEVRTNEEVPTDEEVQTDEDVVISTSSFYVPINAKAAPLYVPINDKAAPPPEEERPPLRPMSKHTRPACRKSPPEMARHCDFAPGEIPIPLAIVDPPMEPPSVKAPPEPKSDGRRSFGALGLTVPAIPRQGIATHATLRAMPYKPIPPVGPMDST